MNKKQPMTFLLIGTIVALGTSLIASTTVVYAEKNIWKGYDTMQKLVKGIEHNGKNDDNMNWKKFQDTQLYQQEDKATKKCIKERADLGNNLADYEIVRCFQDDEYYKYN